jgi:murein DD-endopeptidase MepM/ murein hydrolase activator NlpD
VATLTPSNPLTTERPPETPKLSPTPNAPRTLPPLRSEPINYTVQAGDSLGPIAQRHLVSVDKIVQENNLENPDLLEIGQVLVIPPPKPIGTGTNFKVVPNSELIYSPGSVDFDTASFIREHGGYLASYAEEVGDITLTGIQIVERIAKEFSVNPRILLAVLQYQSRWVTDREPDESTLIFPIGIYSPWREGLYKQLAWAANNLNHGYYLWRVNGLSVWVLADGNVLNISPIINAGTAGVQHIFSQLYELDEWEQAVSPEGVFSTYNDLFGYPFDYTIEPILPSDLSQPPMQLPFEPGVVWSFTGGPHGGWGDGSAWAALDFAPPGEALGCVQNNAWVVAIADGTILRAENGAVVQDLDTNGLNSNDGIEQTGWTILYMHIESRDRINPGTYVRAGERIGHPSCEGGVSSGTHVHLARRYNGEWIPTDQDQPFVLDGWVSVGLGNVYDGYLQRDGQSVEAWEGRSDENTIQR